MSVTHLHCTECGASTSISDDHKGGAHTESCSIGQGQRGWLTRVRRSAIPRAVKLCMQSIDDDAKEPAVRIVMISHNGTEMKCRSPQEMATHLKTDVAGVWRRIANYNGPSTDPTQHSLLFMFQDPVVETSWDTVWLYCPSLLENLSLQ